MSEVMLDFSMIPGQKPETYDHLLITDFREPSKVEQEGAYVPRHLAEDAVEIDEISPLRQLHEEISSKIEPALQKLSAEKSIYERRTHRWQAVAVGAAAVALGVVVSFAAFGGTEEGISQKQDLSAANEHNDNAASETQVESAPKALSSHEIERIAEKHGLSKERLLASNNLADTDIHSDDFVYFDGGIISQPEAEFNTVSLRIENGLTLSHIAQALAVVRGDGNMKSHLLNQIQGINPEAIDELEIGQEIALPSDVEVEELRSAMNEIDRGCQVIPRLGNDAVIEGTSTDVRQQLEDLSTECGRDLAVVYQQVQQRNPEMNFGKDIEYAGIKPVVVPFGSLAIEGDN